MVLATIFRAEEMVRANPRSVEPDMCIASWNYILLHAKRRHEEAVNDILRRQCQLYIATKWDMQFVNLSLTGRMLRLPHPLFADNLDIKPVAWRLRDVEV